MNVVRGQIANVRAALRARETPSDLAGRAPLVAVARPMKPARTTNNNADWMKTPTFCTAHRNCVMRETAAVPEWSALIAPSIVLVSFTVTAPKSRWP